MPKPEIQIPKPRTRNSEPRSCNPNPRNTNTKHVVPRRDARVNLISNPKLETCTRTVLERYTMSTKNPASTSYQPQAVKHKPSNSKTCIIHPEPYTLHPPTPLPETRNHQAGTERSRRCRTSGVWGESYSRTHSPRLALCRSNPIPTGSVQVKPSNHLGSTLNPSRSTLHPSWSYPQSISIQPSFHLDQTLNLFWSNP